MTSKEIQSFRTKVESLIAARRLREAFVALSDMCHRRMAWEVSDRLEKDEKAYAFMLSYVARGIDDPEREQVYDGIVTNLYSILDTLVRIMEKNESSTLYYNTLRTCSIPGRNIEIPVVLHTLLHDNSETVRHNMFMAVWTAYPLSQSDEEALLGALTSPEITDDTKILIISAIMLGMLQFYDARRLGLILRTYMSSSQIRIKAVALVAALLCLWKHRARSLDRRTGNILDIAKDGPHWDSDLRTVCIEMIRTRNTEQINRKMMDEVIPKIIELRPDIMKKIRDGKINPEDAASIQENPEWQEMMDKSGVTDRLKELTEMQQEGGDVFMSTFSHLKYFPFFSDIANWFLPFSTDYDAVKNTASQLGNLSDLVDKAKFMCDSDKYSFIFAMGAMPQAQREMMSSQLAAQSDALLEMQSHADNDTRETQFRHAVNNYLQNIYRFFKLYNRKDEFDDPFAGSINLISVPALVGDFKDAEMLQVLAEFHFRLGFYDDALDIYNRLDTFSSGDAQRYQKMGYCSEKTGDTEQAIEYYRRAELLDGASQWTKRRLASALRRGGYIDEALDRYRRLSEESPDNINIALQYGYILTDKGKYTEAINQFYKVEFLDEKSSRAWRPLAWTLFLTHNFEEAQKYYDKILSDKPTAGDYLNMGHTAAALNNLRNAINNYTLSLHAAGGDREKFLASLNADASTLIEAGISPQTIALLADTVFYSLDK